MYEHIGHSVKLKIGSFCFIVFIGHPTTFVNHATIWVNVVSMDKKRMGSRMVNWFLLLVCFSLLYSCKKDNPAIDKRFIGTWVWQQTTEGNTVLADRSSGLEKKITFTTAGTISVTYNDSTGNGPTLMVYTADTLRSGAITATTTYQFTSLQAAPCDPAKIPSLIVQGFGSYQYDIAGDTLLLSGSPCLAPVSSMYVRN